MIAMISFILFRLVNKLVNDIAKKTSIFKQKYKTYEPGCAKDLTLDECDCGNDWCPAFGRHHPDKSRSKNGWAL